MIYFITLKNNSFQLNHQAKVLYNLCYCKNEKITNYLRHLGYVYCMYINKLCVHLSIVFIKCMGILCSVFYKTNYITFHFY